MDYYMLGVICGLVATLAIALIAWMIHHKRNPNSGKFDERQMVGRGKAFQAGFFTTLICCAGVSIWEYIAGSLPGVPFVWHISAVFVGVAVYALTAIHFDAYIGIYDKPNRLIFSGLCFVASMVLFSFTNLNSAREESHVMAIIDLEVAAMWVLIVAAMLLHRRNADTEDEE